MTGLREVVDTEWSNVVNSMQQSAASNAPFDFYNSLQTMTRTVQNTLNQNSNRVPTAPPGHSYPPHYLLNPSLRSSGNQVESELNFVQMCSLHSDWNLYSLEQ